MSLATMCDRTSGTLKRKVLVKDASGGMTMASYAAVSGYSGFACDIQPAKGSTRLQYMQEQANVTHTIFTESEIPAKPEDIIVIEGRTFQFRGREMPAVGYDQWPAQMHVEEQLG